MSNPVHNKFTKLKSDEYGGDESDEYGGDESDGVMCLQMLCKNEKNPSMQTTRTAIQRK